MENCLTPKKEDEVAVDESGYGSFLEVARHEEVSTTIEPEQPDQRGNRDESDEFLLEEDNSLKKGPSPDADSLRGSGIDSTNEIIATEAVSKSGIESKEAESMKGEVLIPPAEKKMKEDFPLEKVVQHEPQNDPNNEDTDQTSANDKNQNLEENSMISNESSKLEQNLTVSVKLTDKIIEGKWHFIYMTSYSGLRI